MSFEKERWPWKNANVKHMRRIFFFLVVEAHLFKVLKSYQRYIKSYEV